MVVIVRNGCYSETFMNNDKDKSHEAFTNSNMRMSFTEEHGLIYSKAPDRIMFDVNITFCGHNRI